MASSAAETVDQAQQQQQLAQEELQRNAVHHAMALDSARFLPASATFSGSTTLPSVTSGSGQIYSARLMGSAPVGYATSAPAATMRTGFSTGVAGTICPRGALYGSSRSFATSQRAFGMSQQNVRGVNSAFSSSGPVSSTGAAGVKTASKRVTATTAMTGAPIMVGQTQYTTEYPSAATFPGSAMTTTTTQQNVARSITGHSGTGGMTGNTILSSSRGAETLQHEHLVSSSVLNESYMGPAPQEEEVQYVEVPVIEEVVKTIPKREYVDVDKVVPKYEYEWIERIVEVPQIQIVEREVEVPQVHEVVREVHVQQTVDRPYDVITQVPRVVKKIVEQEVEVTKVIEVPKPYTVENRVVVPRYSDTEVPVVVAQRLVPRVAESSEHSVDVELTEYVPKLVPVEVLVPKPVQRSLFAVNRADKHQVVDIPIAHFNALLKLLNVTLTPEELQLLLVKEASTGAVSLAAISGPLVSPISDEWRSGHVEGKLHYIASVTSSGTTTGFTTTGGPTMAGLGQWSTAATTNSANPALGKGATLANDTGAAINNKGASVVTTRQVGNIVGGNYNGFVSRGIAGATTGGVSQMTNSTSNVTATTSKTGNTAYSLGYEPSYAATAAYTPALRYNNGTAGASMVFGGGEVTFSRVN